MFGLIKSYLKDVAGPLIGGAFGLAGSKESSRSAENINAQLLQDKQVDRELQKEFAQHGVRWKVKDAKAAGLHPLFALGGYTSSYSPSPVSLMHDTSLGDAMSNMGQNLSQAISQIETPFEREMRNATLENLQAQTQKEHAISAYYASEAARTAQGAEHSKPIPAQTYPYGSKSGDALAVSDVEHMYDSTRAEPSRMMSARSHEPGIAAGINPALVEYNLPGGSRVLAPFNEEGITEALESLPIWMYPMLIDANKDYYGDDWDIGFVRSFFPRSVLRYGAEYLPKAQGGLQRWFDNARGYIKGGE